MRQPDGVDVRERAAHEQAGESAAAGIEPQPPTGGLDQIAGASAVGLRIAAAAAEDDEAHRPILHDASGA
jgi:hypothetical protein